MCKRFKIGHTVPARRQPAGPDASPLENNRHRGHRSPAPSLAPWDVPCHKRGGGLWGHTGLFMGWGHSCWHHRVGAGRGASPEITSPWLFPSFAPISAPGEDKGHPARDPIVFLCFFPTTLGCWPGGKRAPGGLDGEVLRGLGARPPLGLPGAVSPALLFPCSVVLRGQEALHCKAPFQDFLQRPSEQDAAVHRASRRTCGPWRCWGGLGTPPSSPFQASPREHRVPWGLCGGWDSSHGIREG